VELRHDFTGSSSALRRIPIGTIVLLSSIPLPSVGRGLEIASSEYGGRFTAAAAARDRIAGVVPSEKLSTAGLRVRAAYCEIVMSGLDVIPSSTSSEKRRPIKLAASKRCDIVRGSPEASSIAWQSRRSSPAYRRSRRSAFRQTCGDQHRVSGARADIEFRSVGNPRSRRRPNRPRVRLIRNDRSRRPEPLRASQTQSAARTSSFRRSMCKTAKFASWLDAYGSWKRRTKTN